MADSFNSIWKGRLKYLWDLLHGDAPIDGDLTFSGGITFEGGVTFQDDVFLTGGSIDFPATQVPSANPNSLDDYEENTFTVAIGDGAGNNYTISSQACDYTKIGRVVFYRVIVNWTSIGAATAAQLRIGALPFTAAANGHAAAIGSEVGLDHTATLNPITCQLSGTSIFFERVNDNAAPTNLPANSSSASGGVSIRGTYHV